jgi:four helix bundle protein
MRDEKTRQDLRAWTRKFALRIIKLFTALPRNDVARTIGRQLLRSGTSVGAHYHESIRSRSRAEWVSKIEGGTQELEETSYWLELLIDAEVFPRARLADLIHESDELMAIFTSSVKVAKAKRGV